MQYIALKAPLKLVFTGTSIINAHTSPWAKQPTVDTCSLSEVMSEQLAEKLQEANEKEADKQYVNNV